MSITEFNNNRFENFETNEIYLKKNDDYLALFLAHHVKHSIAFRQKQRLGKFRQRGESWE